MEELSPRISSVYIYTKSRNHKNTKNRVVKETEGKRGRKEDWVTIQTQYALKLSKKTARIPVILQVTHGD
jgi:hypothetical protein